MRGWSASEINIQRNSLRGAPNRQARATGPSTRLRFDGDGICAEIRGVESPQEVRIDKWLWAVRLYKTRGVAAEACRTGQVTIGGQTLKPARSVHVGEVISARTGDLLRTVRVCGLVERRVGPKIVGEFMEDQTPAEEYLRVARLKTEAAAAPQRPKGAGRPTKKERRDLEAFM